MKKTFNIEKVNGLIKQTVSIRAEIKELWARVFAGLESPTLTPKHIEMLENKDSLIWDKIRAEY